MSEPNPGLYGGREVGIIVVPCDPVPGELDDPVPVLVLGVGQIPPVLKVEGHRFLTPVQLVNPAPLIPVPPDEPFVHIPGDGMDPSPDAIDLLGPK
jgi:hypothetical protein